MTTRVINDPAALGWEFDPNTGRWTWGGSGSGSGGGGEGGTFPEAPVDGKQYGRQNASWTEIVGGGGGGGGNDPRITDQQITSWDEAYSWGDHGDVDYMRWSSFSETDPTVPQHVKDISQADINKWNSGTGGDGGGGGNDPRITDTQISNWDTAYGWGNHASKGYLTSASLNGYATQAWVGQNYQPKGSYALTSHNHSGVYAPVSHTHNYAAVGASYTKAESDGRYEPKGAGAGFDGNYSAPSPAKFTMTGADGSAFWVSSSSSARGAEIRLQAGNNSQYFRCGKSGNFEIVNSAYTAVTFQCTNAGAVIASGDVTAYSDVRLKENIETLDGSKVYQMRGVSFTKDGCEGSGVIAQELLEVAPELVNEDGEYLSVAYGNLVGYLIEAVKELKAEVEELKRG